MLGDATGQQLILINWHPKCEEILVQAVGLIAQRRQSRYSIVWLYEFSLSPRWIHVKVSSVLTLDDLLQSWNFNA
jgi:hypothetical protein